MASEVPSTRRNTLSGSWAVGLLAAAAAARRMSSSVTSVELVTFLVISVVVRPQLAQVVATFGFHVPLVPNRSV